MGLRTARTTRWVAERTIGWAERLRVLSSIPAKWRAVAIQGAIAVLLVALGVVIGKGFAWILIAISLTVIVLFGIATMVGGAATAATPLPPPGQKIDVHIDLGGASSEVADRVLTFLEREKIQEKLGDGDAD